MVWHSPRDSPLLIPFSVYWIQTHIYWLAMMSTAARRAPKADAADQLRIGIVRGDGRRGRRGRRQFCLRGHLPDSLRENRPLVEFYMQFFTGGSSPVLSSVRSVMFIDPTRKLFESSVGSDIGDRPQGPEYAAPTGLKFCLGCDSTNMPRLSALGIGSGARLWPAQRDQSQQRCLVGCVRKI